LHCFNEIIYQLFFIFIFLLFKKENEHFFWHQFFPWRQTAARALMPPPWPSNNLQANPVHAQSRFGASSSKNSWKQRAGISTSSNTSSSISGSSFRAGVSSSTRTGHSSNLSSNSDAHKPRRKRRPKKKKQQVCYPWL